MGYFKKKFLENSRKILRVKVNITSERAIEIAKIESRKAGYPWLEPVEIKEYIWNYYIVSNSDYIGGNVFVWISVKDGKAAFAGYAEK